MTLYSVAGLSALKGYRRIFDERLYQMAGGRGKYLLRCERSVLRALIVEAQQCQVVTTPL